MDLASDDTEYEVSADMLIHEDVDDERTLDEEEMEHEEDENELYDLQKESEIPLEQLLASYRGYENIFVNTNSPSEESSVAQEVIEEGVSAVKPPPPELIHVPPDLPTPVKPDVYFPIELLDQTNSSTESSRSDESANKRQVDHGTGGGTSSTGSNGQSSQRGAWFRPGADLEALARLRPVPERRSIRMGHHSNEDSVVDNTIRMWLLSDNSDNADDDSANDEDYISNDWKQHVNVGKDYQAEIPNMLTRGSRTRKDKLLWKPDHIDEESLQDYLMSIEEILLSREGLPCGTLQRDNEEALHALVYHNYNIEKALDDFTGNAMTSKGMRPWTEDECRKFEAGLRAIGKDFYLLQKQVPSRTVKEIVEFYYLWKKTERHDAFTQTKPGKKFIFRPGYYSDFMEELLEPPRSDIPDIHYGSTTLASEVKKERSSLEDRFRHISKTVSAKSS